MEGILHAVSFFFFFGLVVGLAYLTSRVLGGRLGWGGATGRVLRVVEATSLGRDRSLVLVELAGRYYLVGSTAGSINLLTAVEDPAAVAQIQASAPPPPPLPDLRQTWQKLAGRWPFGTRRRAETAGPSFQSLLARLTGQPDPTRTPAAAAPDRDSESPNRLEASIERLRQAGRGSGS